MRLWSLHPKYLDAKGLVALWREALLAQAVLRGRTRGYRHHPQLARFLELPSPCGGIAQYLRVVHAESLTRGYAFTSGKISRARCFNVIDLRRGQLEYEWEHLMRKLKLRDPARAKQLQGIRQPQAHPLFRIVSGSAEEWERPASGQRAVVKRVERKGSGPIALRTTSKKFSQSGRT